MFVCYRKIKSVHCMKNLRLFVNKVLKQIPKNADNSIFGDENLFDKNSDPLTNIEMKTNLEKLKKLLENNIYEK